MIDGGKLYDWLEARGIEMVRHYDPDLYPEFLDREEFGEMFREYVAELTRRG